MKKCTDCSYHHTNSTYDGDKESHCYMFETHNSNKACSQFKAIKKPELPFVKLNEMTRGVPIGELNIIMSGKGRSIL